MNSNENLPIFIRPRNGNSENAPKPELMPDDPGRPSIDAEYLPAEAITAGASPEQDPAEKATESMMAVSKEVHKKAEGMGEWAVNAIRTAGEWYNRRSVWGKILVGAGLGVGAAAASPFSAGLSTGLLCGMWVQRGFGGLGMFVKFEKNLQNAAEGDTKGILRRYEWYREFVKNRPDWQRTAMAGLVAATLTGGLGYGIHKAVNYFSENYGTAVPEWLKQYYPFGHGAGTPSVAQHAQPTSADSFVQADHIPLAPASPEMPTVSVGASPGRGYEDMAWRLWKQLHDNNATLPANVDPHSDLAQLINADEKSIGGLVHRLAEKHAFFNPDGTSIAIDPHAHLSISAEGQLHFGDPTHPDAVQAPEHAPTTPSYPSETHVEHTEEWFAAHPPVADNPATPEQVAASTSPEAHTVYGDVVTNKSGILIPLQESHVYADAGAKHLLVYGGGPREQANAMLKYLTEHPDKMVYGTDEQTAVRVPFKLIDGKLAVAGGPVQTGGFLGFFKSLMQAPKPDELQKLIQ